MRVKLQHYFLLLLFSLYICRCLYSYENYTHIFTCEYNCKHMHKNTVPSGAHTQLTKLPLCFHPSAYGVCPLPLIHPLWKACFIYILTSACGLCMCAKTINRITKRLQQNLRTKFTSHLNWTVQTIYSPSCVHLATLRTRRCDRSTDIISLYSYFSCGVRRFFFCARQQMLHRFSLLLPRRVLLFAAGFFCCCCACSSCNLMNFK